MTATTKRTALGASLTLATAVAVSGCQSDEGPTAAAPPSAGQPVAKGERVDGKQLGAQLVTAARAAKSVRVTAEVADRRNSGVTADLSFRSPTRTDVQVDVPARASDGAVQVRLVDGTAYLTNPKQTGPRWVSAGPSTRNPLARSALQLTQQVLTQGPTGQADLLARSTVTTAGVETVGGTKATRYTVTVPATAVLSQLETAVRPLSQRDPEATRKLGALRQMVQGVTLTQDLWVDQQNRPLKVAMALPPIFGGEAKGPGATPAFSLTFSQWGKAVNIAAPPAAQTKSVDEVWGQRTPPTRA